MNSKLLRPVIWAAFILGTTVALDKIQSLKLSYDSLPLQKDIGVGPIHIEDKWLTNRVPLDAEQGLGTRFYIVLDPCINLNLQGEFAPAANFRTYPWVFLPPAGQTFSNCNWNIKVNGLRYWQVRGRQAPALFVLGKAESARLLPKF